MEPNRLNKDEHKRGDKARKGQMVVFTGSTPNIGTTLVMTGAAVHLARRTDCSIAIICLNLKSSKLHRYMGRDEVPAGLDGLRADMKSRCLNTFELARFFEPVAGLARLHVLYGSQMREQAEFYQPDDIRHLLDTARGAFDICLVDVNAYWDNAATITALLDADEKVMVTTPDLGHFQEDLDRGLKTMAPLFGLPPESFLLVVNQDGSGGKGGLRVSDIRKESGMELSAVIGYDPELREWLNQGRLVEYASGSRPFAQSVDLLADQLGERLGLKPSMDKPSSPGILKWMPILSGR